jgi:hypothetical protein
VIMGEHVAHHCHVAWRSPHRLGVAFA